MSTGGQAFPGPHWSEGETGMTLLDWFAGQALAGLCSSWYDRHKDDPETQRGYGPMRISQSAYTHAEYMLAEKARREADHSGDANKMVQGPTAADNERWARFQDGIRIAFSPTGGWLAEIRDGSMSYGDSIADAIANLRARWEGKNVVPYHPPDTSKTAKQPDACALLRKFIDAVPEGFETSLLWDLRKEAIHLLDVVPDHSPDAGKMALEAANRELVEALEALLDCISETRGKNASDAAMNARAILAKHKGAA